MVTVPAAPTTKEHPMIYLIAGLDRRTFARWHDNVMASDTVIATRIACARAAAQGIDLVIAAIVGPYSSLVSDGADLSPSSAAPSLVQDEAA
jgi:hypothetical protein